MLGYVIRRVLYMVPTVFGIILVTFVLFNVAGGDPAVMKLGKQASSRSLEEFDVLRGYDKPLLLGRWGRTRAYADSEFDRTPGPWSRTPGAVYSNEAACVLLPAATNYALPLAFALPASTDFRWDLRYRLRDAPGGAPGRAALTVTNGAAGSRRLALEPGGVRTLRVPFRTGPAPAEGVGALAVEQGALELQEATLRRRTAHLFDSQLWFYLRHVAVLDFGVSHETNQRVADMIRSGIGPSLALMVPMFLVGLIVSICLALICAFFRNTFVDRFLVVVSVVLMSVNYLVWIVLGQYTLGYQWRWFPVWGFESVRYLVLPCLIGVVSGLGSELRFYRTVMLDEMYRDYVRTAMAKGVGRGGVLFRHVLKNAMIPILTGVVMEIPFLFTGSLLLESFFGIPGLGRMGINGIYNADVDVIRALVLVGAVIYVIANLITDLCYAWVDPRVKLR